MIQQILTDEDPTLREMSREVTLEELATPEVQQVIDDMLHTLRATTGVGLAAPQIGKQLRIVIVDKPMTVIVNPVITPEGATKDMCYEGCLSVPGKRGEVERWRAVRVRGLTREGKPIEATWVKFRANVIQHEVDHLDGILYLDRATMMFADDAVYAPAPRQDPQLPVKQTGDLKTYVVQSPDPVGGKQTFAWQFQGAGRVTQIRVSPGSAVVMGVWLAGVKLRAGGFKIGAVNKMLLGEHGLHVAPGDQLRFEVRMPSGKKKIVAEADFDG